MTVNIHQAKTHLSKLVERVQGDEEVTIARAGVPVARLVPVPRDRSRPVDLDRGRFKVPDDFDAPLPARVLAAFGAAVRKNTMNRKGGGKG